MHVYVIAVTCVLCDWFPSNDCGFSMQDSPLELTRPASRPPSLGPHHSPHAPLTPRQAPQHPLHPLHHPQLHLHHGHPLRAKRKTLHHDELIRRSPVNLHGEHRK